MNERGVQKPGTITVVDAGTFRVTSETNGLGADGLWNNPHNMWANFRLDTIYNANWFGKWINKIDRATGRILQSITVGEAPTHIVTIPTPGDQFGVLTIPLSADNDLVKVEDGPQGLKIVGKSVTGAGKTHPHGHWLTCGDGDRAVVPNVFKGIGTAGSISIMDTATGRVLKEFTQDPKRSSPERHPHAARRGRMSCERGAQGLRGEWGLRLRHRHRCRQLADPGQHPRHQRNPVRH